MCRVNVATKESFDEVLLDNQADISLVHPMHLENLLRSSTEVIKGISGEMKVNTTGELPGFFRCRTSDEIDTNILSLAEIEDHFRVVYTPKKKFTVYTHRGKIDFLRRDKLYVASMRDIKELMSTRVNTTKSSNIN